MGSSSSQFETETSGINVSDIMGPSTSDVAPQDTATAGEPAIPPATPPAILNPTTSLMDLPFELLNHIFEYLEPADLFCLAQTCRRLHTQSVADASWQRHIQASVPGTDIKTPYPFATYRDLYLSLDPYWFLPRHKIWFADDAFVGKLLVARYDPRRNCIEAYRMVAETPEPDLIPWEIDEEVSINPFSPTVKLHMDQPVLELKGNPRNAWMGRTADDERVSPHRSSFMAEVPMQIGGNLARGIQTTLILVKPAQIAVSWMRWPPTIIPAPHCISNAQDVKEHAKHKPLNRFEVSDQGFRIRRWARGGPLLGLTLRLENTMSVQLNADLHTYSTLDPKLYTPTHDKPWRGIWVGDYNGHGCEFLLMHQPDADLELEPSNLVVDYEPQRPDESVDAFEARRRHERTVYRGRLEAIKLTGDPNVQRGSYSWIADDLGSGGFLRVAHEDPFRGARVVKSRGHIATRGYINNRFIETQLIIISPDRLAMFWIGFSHISYFHRVNIDDFTRV